jgi:hypothetical protein
MLKYNKKFKVALNDFNKLMYTLKSLLDLILMFKKIQSLKFYE